MIINVDKVATAMTGAVWSAVKVVSCAAFLSLSVASSENESTGSSYIVPFSNVVWSPLNPARGKLGPKAANLWGNRTQSGVSGFLVEFRQGFASPPHIHNVSYRGIVIAGLLHNDDPDAEDMWLRPESYWTQPAGDVHITSANAEYNLAYIEIDDGPYLVRSTDEAFDNGEASVNLERSNMVWLNGADMEWMGRPGTDTQVSFLWGQPNDGVPFGSLLRLPSGFSGKLISGHSDFRAVTIRGEISLNNSSFAQQQSLSPGGYFGSDGKTDFSVACGTNDPCTLYVRASTPFALVEKEH